MSVPAAVIKHLGRVPYEPTWKAMERYTLERGADAPDEVWFLEHPPVFTLGLAGKREHLLAPGDIPVIQIDRGGQVTYHGPGQLVVYPLVDLKRLKLGVRELVCALERAVCSTLEGYGVAAAGRRDAPGVYITAGPETGKKVASIGIRIRRGASYHGLAFNITDDCLPAFQRINPCGYAGLEVTSVQRLLPEGRGPVDLARVAKDLEPHLLRELRL